MDASGPGASRELSERERQVARYVAFGMRDDEVGATLSISPHTVRAHLRRIFRKLAVRRRTQLFGEALRLNII